MSCNRQDRGNAAPTLLAVLSLLGCSCAEVPAYTAARARLTELELPDGCLDSPTGRGGPMCAVPEGSFMMGCNDEVDDECLADEHPYHEVWLDHFLIDHHEVTVADYRDCVEAGACEAPRWGWGPWFCNYDNDDRGDHPQNCMEWFHARDYCAWVGKRLPTEAEWEKAARGTDGRKYAWGSEPRISCEMAVIDDGRDGCGENHTWPVCSKPAGLGPYQTCDMNGNTYEWTADWYDATYYERSPAKNPTGPDAGELRVLRGGSWNRQWERARVSHRVGYKPAENPYCRGFRCAFTPDQEGTSP
jgi:formylglycine-generating enzyme required for sulfatase activity